MLCLVLNWEVMRVVKSWETSLMKELTLRGRGKSWTTSLDIGEAREEIDTETSWLQFEGGSAKFKDNQKSALCYSMTKLCKTGKTTVSDDGSTVKSIDVLILSFTRNIEKLKVRHFFKAFIFWNWNVRKELFHIFLHGWLQLHTGSRKVARIGS